MTTLILGLDGLDYNRVQENGYLSDFDVQHLEQDLEGPNALYTKRVWPCIFAGTSGGASNPEERRAEYHDFQPDTPYIWESYPSKVLLPPIPNAGEHDNGDELPDKYVESFSPDGRIERTLDGLKKDIQAGIDDPGISLVVACTRTPDIVGHHLPEKAEYYHEYVDKWVSDLEFPENYLIVSDHGFGEFGGDGIEAHTEDAILASNFASYGSMTEFTENWREELHEVVLEDQLDALGYR